MIKAVRRLILILFFLFSFPAHTLTAAQAKKLWDRSLKTYAAGDFERSRNLLLYLVKAQPKNALYWFNLGNSYFMLGQFPYAETCFYKVETLRSKLAPAARLYRAKALKERGEAEAATRLLQQLLKSQLPKTLRDEAHRDLVALTSAGESGNGTVTDEVMRLYREGKYRRALRILKQAEIQDDNINMLRAMILIKLDREDRAHDILSRIERVGDEPLKDLARNLLERIRNAYSKPRWVFAELAAGQDSNVYGAHEATAAGTLAAQAGAGGRFMSQGLWYGTGGYSLRHRQVFDHDDLQFLQHEARLNFGREVATDLIALSPFFQHESYDNDPRRFAGGAALRWRTGDAGLEFGADAEWTEERAMDHDYRYLTGSTQNYVIYSSLIHNPFYARAFLRWSRQDTGDQETSTGGLVPYAHRGYGPGFSVLWRMRLDWTVELAAAYQWREYPTPPSSGPKRKDKEWSLSARLTKTFTPQWAVYSALGSRENNSTLNDSAVSNENYSQFQILAGVIWDAI